MRQNSFEKIKKVLFTVGKIVAFAIIIIGIVFIVSRAVKIRKIVNSQRAVTESATENVPDSGTQTGEFYMNEDGDILYKEMDIDDQVKVQESEEENAPADRDVAPENDPNYNSTVAAPEADVQSDIMP